VARLACRGITADLGERPEAFVRRDQCPFAVAGALDTDTDVVPTIEAGATGYLLKDSPPDELLRGVRAAAPR